MPQAVLALGAATVTAAGCVWYLPALADLRAGADRPLARRRTAVACLSGWATTGIVAVLLLIGIGLAVAVAAAALGAVAERERGVAWWTVAAVPSTVVGLFLTLAVLYGRALQYDRSGPSGRRR